MIETGQATDMQIHLETATADDAPAIASLRAAVAQDLTARYGKGHWSSGSSAKGVLRAIGDSRVCIAREEKRLLATLRLATKKPWAIDKSYFSACKRPLYLTDMAVDPELQRQGIGRPDACRTGTLR